MKSFKDFMEDGAGAVGSGAAGLQSSGGSPAIPTTTRGVAGAGDDSSTVPVSKKKQYSMTKFNKSEYKRTVPTVPLRARVGRVKEVKEEHSIHIKTYDRHGEKQLGSKEFKKHVKDHGGEVDYVTDKGVAFKFKTPQHADQFHRGVISKFRDLGSEKDDMYEAKETSPRRITSTIRVGEKTAPAQTFMTKEETVKSQKDIVAANSKTSENPTGAIPKRKKLFSDMRIKEY